MHLEKKITVLARNPSDGQHACLGDLNRHPTPPFLPPSLLSTLAAGSVQCRREKKREGGREGGRGGEREKGDRGRDGEKGTATTKREKEKKTYLCGLGLGDKEVAYLLRM